MRRMTEAEQAAVHEWEVRQGAFNDPIHLDLTWRECLLYAVGGVATIALSALFPWGFA